MRHVVILGLAGVVILLLLSLSSTPESLLVTAKAQEPLATCAPTPDLVAFETRIAARIYATLTASAPTKSPTGTATATATRIAAAGFVWQDVTVPIGQWEVTLLSARRDKTIWSGSDPRTASGVWATLIFRIKNLQASTDFIYKSFRPLVWTDLTGKEKPIQGNYDLEARAQWFYSCCGGILDDVPPGQERVILVSFDVPEKSQALHVEFFGMDWVPPVFVVPNFAQIPPRPMN